MKKFALLVALLVGMATAADAQPTIRVGGGLIFDNTVWGGVAAVDIPISEETPIFISPFLEYYRKSGVNTIPFGANVLYKAPLGADSGTFYIGAGGGGINVNKGAGTTYVIDAVGGIQFPLGESLNIYGEVKYMYASKKKNNIKTIDLSDVGAAVGISFGLGQ